MSTTKNITDKEALALLREALAEIQPDSAADEALTILRLHLTRVIGDRARRKDLHFDRRFRHGCNDCKAVVFALVDTVECNYPGWHDRAAWTVGLESRAGGKGSFA